MKVVGQKHYKQYPLKKILGTGSFGTVYLSPPYAVKEMKFEGVSPFVVDALKNQVSILRSFHDHPNIVKLVDHFYEGMTVYLVMQYCESDLKTYLDRKPNLTEKQAFEILKQILSGFKQLVKQGIIHRDLKPANILVNSKGEFKLCDFGFAKFVDHYESKLMQSIVGSPLFMAPQILGRKPYTTKCDIWSIGYIYYYLLFHNYPWMGTNEKDLLNNITKYPLTFRGKVSEFSQKLLTKMLKVNETERVGWDELFHDVLSSQSNPKNERPGTQRPGTERPTSKAKDAQRQHSRETPRRQQRCISHEKRKIFPAKQNTPPPTAKNTPTINKNIPATDKKTPGTNKSIPANCQDPPPNGRKRQQAKSEKQVAIDYIMCDENIIKSLVTLQLQRMYDSEMTTKIVNDVNTHQQKFKKILENFNEDFQKAAINIFSNKK